MACVALTPGGYAPALLRRPPRPPRRRGLPIVVDPWRWTSGLVPISMTSDRYVPLARKAGAQIAYWRVTNAQHFDSLLAFPDYRKRYVPLLPYMFAAMDQVWDHLRIQRIHCRRMRSSSQRPRAEAPLLREQLSIPAAQAMPNR